MKSEIVKSIAILFIISGFISVVSADAQNWRMQYSDNLSVDRTGVNTTTIQVVSLEYNKTNVEGYSWAPITPETVQDSYLGDDNDPGSITYRYNKSDGNKTKLSYLGDRDSYYKNKPYWYAEITPNKTKGDMLYFKALGNTTDGVKSIGFENHTQNISIGDYEVKIQNDVKDFYKAGKEIKVQASAYYRDQTGQIQSYVDRTNGGSANVTFVNASAEIGPEDLAEYRDNYFVDSQVQIPEETNSTYIMQVEIEDDDSHSSFSKLVGTYPAIRGELTEISSSNRCDKQEITESCERGANISIEYGITASNAKSVNMTIYKFDGSDRLEIGHKSLQKESSNSFTGEYEMPDMDTSEYTDQVEFKFNASNDDRSHVDRRNITLASFEFNDNTEQASLGDVNDIELVLRKKFSKESYSLDWFNELELNLSSPSGN
ncbi:MAG: hypothetical protein V5A72_01605, partial [Candidatus Nanohaloarchaea archaeon]